MIKLVILFRYHYACDLVPGVRVPLGYNNASPDPPAALNIFIYFCEWVQAGPPVIIMHTLCTPLTAAASTHSVIPGIRRSSLCFPHTRASVRFARYLINGLINSRQGRVTPAQAKSHIHKSRWGQRGRLTARLLPPSHPVECAPRS